MGAGFSTLVGFDISPPLVAPTVAAGTVSGGMGSGAYSYKVTYVTAYGETDTSPVSATVTTMSGSVILTNIPISPETNTTTRRLYRTLSDGANWFALAVINNNTTTVYVDTNADGSLVTLAPTYNDAMSRAIARGVLSLSSPLVSTSDMFVAAAAGGGQTNATKLSKEYNRVFLVVSAGDSLILPHVASDLAGMKIVVKNDGTNSANIFPFESQSINSLGADNPIALPASGVITFVASTDETWVTF